MAELDILEYLDLQRATPVDTDSQKLSDSEAAILSEVKVNQFDVDFVYFNTDEETKNSFPAVFLKKVSRFNDNEVLKDIAETQRKIWNYKKVLFLYVYSETEIRIYNCTEKPLVVTKKDYKYEDGLREIEIKSSRYSDKEELQELEKLFSRIAIDTGAIWTSEAAKTVRDKINMQRRVDKYLVSSLVNTASILRKQGLGIDFIHRIILRSLFLLYLEDRGAAGRNFYSKIKQDSESYFDILDDIDATRSLFKQLENHFNGNVFTVEQDENISEEQLHVIKTCLIHGNDNDSQPRLFDDWKQFRLFNFKIIQIELLSEIYENFLAETDPTLKEVTGTYYTPPSLVEFILNEKLPVNNGEKEYNMKILDPSCGSGIFLVESYKRLIKRYENEQGIESAKEMVLPFLHKATVLAPEGKVALIFSTKVLTNTSQPFKKFRKWLFQECHVERVYNFSILRKAPEDFGGQLFGDATGPISILFYQKEKPKHPASTITYYAPKTYVKTNIVEGLNIDFTDVKHLPREECEKPDSKIWKIAMWGGIGDWELITNIFQQSTSLKQYFKSPENNWEKPRVGLNKESEKPDFVPQKIINPGRVERYYTPNSASEPNEELFRFIDKKVFTPPFVIMKKGQQKKQLAASYIDYFSYCTTACYIFNGNVDPGLKKALTCILNSKLTTYLLFLTAASWGIEREQVFLDEVLESPALLPLLKTSSVRSIARLFDEILSIKP